MTAMDNVADGNRYARCIQSSKRVHWEIDEDVIQPTRAIMLTFYVIETEGSVAKDSRLAGAARAFVRDMRSSPQA